jgi:hypothetical protein
LHSTVLLPRARLATKRKQPGSRPRYEKPSSASSGSERRFRTHCGYLGMTICRSDLPLSPKLEHFTGGPKPEGWLMLDYASHALDVVLQLSEVSTNVP